MNHAMNPLRTAAFTVLCLHLIMNTSAAQTHPSNGRAFAMGGAYLTLATGVEAARWNPANLGLREAPRLSFMLPSFGVGVSNNAFDQADYNLYNGKKLSSSDKQNILQRLPLSGWNFRLGSGADLFGVSARNMAVLAGVEIISEANLPYDFVDLALNGNAMNRQYDFAGTRGSAMAMATVGVSYGRAIFLPQKSLKLALGATAKYLRGFSFFEITQAQGHVRTTTAGIFGEGRAQARTANGGHGFGLDLGANLTIKRSWQLGLALRNVASFVHWRDNVRLYEYGVHADSLTLVAVETDEDAVFNNASQKTSGRAFFINLPPQVHLGASRQWQRVLLAADLVQNLKAAYGAVLAPELRCGAELQVVPGIPLRGGVRFGGRHKLGSAVGFGVHAGEFEIDLAVGALGGLVPLHGKGMGFALSMSLGR